MLKKLALLITVIPLSFQAEARGIDLKLANEMAEIVYLTESSTFGYGGAALGIGFLFIVPLSLLGIGIFIWWRRRQA